MGTDDPVVFSGFLQGRVEESFIYKTLTYPQKQANPDEHFPEMAFP